MTNTNEVIALKKGRSNVYESPLTNEYVEDHIAVLHWYQGMGWDGCCGHGHAFFMLINAICFKDLEPKDGYDRFDRFVSDLEREGLSEKEIRANIRQCTRKSVDDNIKTILRRTLYKRSKGFDAEWCPSRKLLLAIFDQLDINAFSEFVIYLIRNNDRLRSQYNYFLEYWPHLTIYKDGELRFVEVSRSKRKTKRLAKSHDFYNGVLKPFGFEVIFSVIDEKSDAAPVIEEECLLLEQKGPHAWLSPLSGETVGPEQAVLDSYKRDGWCGTCGEGDVLFFLLQCMSYKDIPLSVCGHDIYKKNKEGIREIAGRKRRGITYNIYAELSISAHRRRGDLREWGDLNDRLTDLENITAEEVGENFDRITSSPKYWGLGEKGGLGDINYYSRFTREMIIGFSESFDRDQLVCLAKSLAVYKDGYRLSFGWPDLTMFKDGRVIFREVKANKDKLRENQEQLILEILKPLGFDVKLIKLKPVKER